jgi:hypothetical protein
VLALSRQARRRQQQAREAVLILAVKREQLHAKVAALAAITQVGVLGVFPGDDEMVRAVLSVDVDAPGPRNASVETPGDAPEG